MRDFLKGYLECALWSSTCNFDSGENFDDAGFSIFDFSPEALAAATADCERFEGENSTDLALYLEEYPEDYAGHDLWLSRNGHGAGFFDRTGVNDASLVRLQNAARAFGGIDLVAGDDGKIHFQ